MESFEQKFQCYFKNADANIKYANERVAQQQKRGDSEKYTKEANTKSYLITPFLRSLLDFDAEDATQVTLEFPHQYGSARPQYIDYALFSDDNLLGIVEAKALQHDFCELADARSSTTSVTDDLSQLIGYSSIKHSRPEVKIVLWTNGIEYRFYYYDAHRVLQPHPCFIFDLYKSTASDRILLSQFSKSHMLKDTFQSFLEELSVRNATSRVLERIWNDLPAVLSERAIHELEQQNQQLSSETRTKNELRKEIYSKTAEFLQEKLPSCYSSLSQTSTSALLSEKHANSCAIENSAPPSELSGVKFLSEVLAYIEENSLTKLPKCKQLEYFDEDLCFEPEGTSTTLNWGSDIMFRSFKILTARYPKFLQHCRSFTRLTRKQRKSYLHQHGALLNCYSAKTHPVSPTMLSLSTAPELAVSTNIKSIDAVQQLRLLCKHVQIDIETVLLTF